MRRGPLPACCCRHYHVAGPERPSGRNAYPSEITPSTITSPTGRTAGSRTEISPGARAHHLHALDRAHAPPDPMPSSNDHNTPRLTRPPTQISSSDGSCAGQLVDPGDCASGGWGENWARLSACPRSSCAYTGKGAGGTDTSRPQRALASSTGDFCGPDSGAVMPAAGAVSVPIEDPLTGHGGDCV